MPKFILSLAIYAVVAVVVVDFATSGNFLDSLQHLGSYLNGQATQND